MLSIEARYAEDMAQECELLRLKIHRKLGKVVSIETLRAIHRKWWSKKRRAFVARTLQRERIEKVVPPLDHDRPIRDRLRGPAARRQLELLIEEFGTEVIAACEIAMATGNGHKIRYAARLVRESLRADRA